MNVGAIVLLLFAAGCLGGLRFSVRGWVPLPLVGAGLLAWIGGMTDYNDDGPSGPLLGVGLAVGGLLVGLGVVAAGAVVAGWVVRDTE
jgi:hypothetical protein